ncbi:hypothetical protein L7F22_051972 [Adiantum nelumboides]|nr:hypothetical protein [Adiantum nelumboides]
MENKWKNYPSRDMEEEKLEACQNLVRITQEMLEKQKPKLETMPKLEKLVTWKQKQKIEVVKEPHIETKEPKLIAPHSEDALDGIPFVEEEHFWKKDADSPRDTWDNLIAFNATNTRARKIQLKNELNTIKKGDLLVNKHTLKMKALCESLSSIGATMDDDDKVEACLRGLGNA